MLKYSKYLLSSVVRKKAPYLIILGFFFIFDFTTWLQVKEVNKNFMPILNSMSTFDKFFPFLFSSFFMAMIVIYAFKQGEGDGSELMIVAKPISRIQIVLGKFFVVFIYLFSFTVLTFLNYFLVSLLDKYITYGERIEYAMSLSLGGAVILIIMGAILIICAAFFRKTGLLAIGIVVAAIVPILSFILSPIGKGQPFSYNFLDNARQHINVSELKKTLSENKGGKNIDGKDFQTIIDSNNIYVGEDTNHLIDHNNYSNEIWYDKASYMDLWYQWGRFYSIFQPNKPSPATITHWKKEVKTVTAGAGDTVTTGDGKVYALSVKMRELVDSPKVLPFLPVMVEGILEHIPGWNALTLYDRLHTIDLWINSLGANEFKENSLNIIDDEFDPSTENNFVANGNISSLAILTYAALDIIFGEVPAPYNVITKPATAYPSFVEITEKTDGVKIITRIGSNNLSVKDEEQLLKVSKFAEVGSKIYVFTADEFIETNHILIVWGILAVAFLALSLVLFLKRDFR